MRCARQRSSNKTANESAWYCAPRTAPACSRLRCRLCPTVKSALLCQASREGARLAAFTFSRPVVPLVQHRPQLDKYIEVITRALRHAHRPI